MNVPALPMAIQAAIANLLHAIMINVVPQPDNIGDPADNPEAGADAAALAEETQSQAQAIETTAVATAFTATPAEPIITPTELLGEWSIDDMLEAGHTLESLEAEGYITVERPKPTPAVGAAATTQKAPAPPPRSTPAAQPSAQGGTDAPAGQAKILDAAGVPWDERIHAGSREQTKACLWKKRKNVDEALYTSLSEELRAAAVEPFTPLAKPDAAPAPAPAAKAPPPPATKPAAPPPPAAAAAATTSSNYPTSLEGTTKDFATLCKYVMDKTLPSVPTDAALKIYGQFGVGTLGMVGKPENVHLVDLVYQQFRELRGEA